MKNSARVGKDMIRAVLSLERLAFLEPEGKVGYRQGHDAAGKVMAFITEYAAVDIEAGVRPSSRRHRRRNPAQKKSLIGTRSGSW